MSVSDRTNEWNELALRTAARLFGPRRLTPQEPETLREEGKYKPHISDFHNNWNKLALAYAAKHPQ